MPPQKTWKWNILSDILSLNSFSYSHIVSDSLPHIKALSIILSIFLMISYIFQWLIRSILQKLLNIFYVPITSSKMQRCLSK